MGAQTAASQIPLYEARQTIYQREVRGYWQDRRALLLYLLAGFYVALPWATWNGRQAVLFDVPGRKFYLLGLTFWPQDFIYVSGLLILGALGLFFVTNLAGRIWCGYACPQTVWTRFFMWLEWLTEGDRNQRILLDRAPWSRRKLARKAAKHASWLVFSAIVGVTFVGYFLPIRDLVVRLVTGPIGSGEAVFLAIASLALYADAGFMREQICKYACPYARFQGAMFDLATVTVLYDPGRGEPRGHRRKDQNPAGLGHCVDCRLCVAVCPTGIDIRDGAQYECIGCAACIDACDGVMTELGFPTGLVRYTSESALAGKPAPLPLLRPRVAGYGALLLAVAAVLGVGLLQRIPLDMDVIRDRARLYREIAGGQIENVYTLKLMNKGQRETSYRVSVQDGFTLLAPASITVAPGELKDVPVQVRAPRAGLTAASTPVRFVVEDTGDASVRMLEEGRFLAPVALHADRYDGEEREHGNDD